MRTSGRATSQTRKHRWDSEQSKRAWLRHCAAARVSASRLSAGADTVVEQPKRRGLQGKALRQSCDQRIEGKAKGVQKVDRGERRPVVTAKRHRRCVDRERYLYLERNPNRQIPCASVEQCINRMCTRSAGPHRR